MADEPSRLLALPVDLVREIYYSFLPDILPPDYRIFRHADEGRKAFKELLNLASTCKVLYLIASPILARYKDQHRFQPGIVDYARTILTNPELAQQETRFEMSLCDKNRIGDVEEGDAAMLDRAAAQLRQWPPPSMYLPLTVIWDAQIRSAFDKYLDHVNRYGCTCKDLGYSDTFSKFNFKREDLADIAMANIPNLTSISVYSVYGYNLRQRATLSLSHLTHAKLTNPDKYWVKLSSDISRFSHYINPASRSLEVLEIEGTYYCTETFVLPQLRSITFNSAGQLWVDDMIKPLLGSSDKLQEFVYRSARYMDYLGRKDEDRFYDYHSYRPIDILRALREIGSHNTIQTLELDLRDEGNKREGNPWYFIETSLAYWKTLKNLRITQQTLWSPASDCHRKRWGEYELEANSLRRLTDILPDSIEFFQLSDITAEFLPSIVILAMHVEGRKGFPKLKKVHLHPSPQLVRQLKHAVAHENDANLMHEECKDSSCVLVSKILNCYRDAEDIFEKAGVEIKFPLEVLPLHTRNSEILQRQQDLCHWCPECHLDGTSCLARVV